MTQTNDHPIGHGTDIIAGSGSEILEQIKSFGWEYGPKIIGAIITLIIGFWIIRLVMKGLGRLFEKKQLDVTFRFMNNILQCVIVDNGVGRNKATEIANRQGHHHESFALGAIEKRLEIFKKQYGPNIGYIINDLHKDETAKGTKVTITMPFNKRF